MLQAPNVVTQTINVRDHRMAVCWHWTMYVYLNFIYAIRFLWFKLKYFLERKREIWARRKKKVVSTEKWWASEKWHESRRCYRLKYFAVLTHKPADFYKRSPCLLYGYIFQEINVWKKSKVKSKQKNIGTRMAMTIAMEENDFFLRPPNKIEERKKRSNEGNRIDITPLVWCRSDMLCQCNKTNANKRRLKAKWMWMKSTHRQWIHWIRLLITLPSSTQSVKHLNTTEMDLQFSIRWQQCRMYTFS